MISPERGRPGTRVVESYVFQAFGAHPSVVMNLDEKARQEGIVEFCFRLRTEAALVVTVGEISIDTLSSRLPNLTVKKPSSPSL